MHTQEDVSYQIDELVSVVLKIYHDVNEIWKGSEYEIQYSCLASVAWSAARSAA